MYYIFNDKFFIFLNLKTELNTPKKADLCRCHHFNNGHLNIKFKFYKTTQSKFIAVGLLGHPQVYRSSKNPSPGRVKVQLHMAVNRAVYVCFPLLKNKTD